VSTEAEDDGEHGGEVHAVLDLELECRSRSKTLTQNPNQNRRMTHGRCVVETRSMKNKQIASKEADRARGISSWIGASSEAIAEGTGRERGGKQKKNEGREALSFLPMAFCL